MYPTQYKSPPKRHRGRKIAAWTLGLLLLLSGYSYYALYRPLPPLQPAVSSLNLQTGTGISQLSWPATGQSAVAVDGTSILETHGTQTPVAIASVAKVIAALTILQKKPLSPGQAGPTITLTDADVALYDAYVAGEGSVIAVRAGEQISEYQMLEAMMLPSANNVSDSLAIWAFGSLDAYRTAAQKYIASIGMRSTTIGTDASGYSASTTSTARDLVILGKATMDHPVLRQIVGLSSASDIPEIGSVDNVNVLLGQSGIIGIKTGNTDQAGGVFLSASTTKVGGKPITVITAILGATNLPQALQNSLPLIASAQGNFIRANLLAEGAVVGEYRQPWGGIIPAAVQAPLGDNAWRGTTLTAKVQLEPITARDSVGRTVGSAISGRTPFSTGIQSNVVLMKAPTLPSKFWRLTHPFN